MYIKSKTGMEVQQLPSREVVEQLRAFVYQNSWTGGQVNLAFTHYKAMGHKYPKTAGCPDCNIGIIKYWRDYIKGLDANG
jgi:hypothetical protein